MKRIFEKIEKAVFYLISLLMREVLPIHKKRVLFWVTDGKDYGCNPMYISKYIVSNEKSFDVWWMFLKGTNIDNLGTNEKVVWYKTLKYLYILNTSEFLITNHRTNQRDMLWLKRREQKYIMTWHGSMPIKMVEKDVVETLGSEYVNMAIKDSQNCDLIISDSEWFTKLLRKSFWYDGEILKTTLPRNQKFYEVDNYSKIRQKVLSYYGYDEKADIYLLLYAPTFRSDRGCDYYITEWSAIKDGLKSICQKDVIILMRLHPNLLKDINTEKLIKDEYVKNASIYNDMQELMVAADMLITDYSSTMFEFSMMQKPCLLYMPDRDLYDRGFYFNLSELPFAQSTTISSLVNDIKRSDATTYNKILFEFVNTYFGLYEQCNGSKKVCDWMLQHSKL